METEPIWFEYVRFDSDGNIVGIRKNAPAEVKKAFEEYKKKQQEYIRKNKPIPR